MRSKLEALRIEHEQFRLADALVQANLRAGAPRRLQTPMRCADLLGLIRKLRPAGPSTNHHILCSSYQADLLRHHSVHFDPTINPPPCPDIHFFELHPSRSFRYLPSSYQQHEDGQEDVVDHKVGGAERVQKSGVALEEDEKDIRGQRRIGSAGVPDMGASVLML